MIARLEHLTTRAWPALESEEVDGWLLRFAGGWTRRSNSVHPVATGVLPLDERIRRCEERYATRGQRTVFKLTDAALPEGLDEALAARGYASEARTDVMVRGFGVRDAAPLCELAAPPPEVRLEPGPSDEWVDACVRLNGVAAGADAENLRKILMQIDGDACFAAIGNGDGTLAQGLAIAAADDEGEGVMLCEIATAESARRSGLAGRIVDGLLGFAAEREAGGCWLQVVAENSAAIALYEKVGFRRAYSYWYRVRG